MTLTLHTIADFEVGQKVTTLAHTDAFMRGLRFGKVASVGTKYVHVIFPLVDHVRRFGLRPEHLHITAPAHCSVRLFAPGHPHDGNRCQLGWDHAEQCVFGTHRADVEPRTDHDHRPPEHRRRVLI